MFSHHTPYRQLFYGAVIFLGTFLLKELSSTASASELRFLLAPVASLIHLLSGFHFSFDSLQGYISQEAGIIIAPACSGINFLLIALTMSMLQGISARLKFKTAIFWCSIAAPAIAYVLTIITNCIRIGLSIQLYQQDIHLAFLTPERLHRITGIIIYYGMLLLIFSINTLLLQTLPFPERTSSFRKEIAPGLLILPFFCYFIITVALPLFHTIPSPQGIEHCLTVILISGSITLLFFAIAYKQGKKTQEKRDIPLEKAGWKERKIQS